MCGLKTIGQLMRNPAGMALSLFLLALSGCSASAQSQKRDVAALEIDGIRIVNELDIDVTNVRILVPATGDFVSCGNILAKTSCSSSFPGRAYQGNAVQISWKESGRPHSTPEFRLEPPASPGKASSTWIEVVIFLPGQAGARFAPREE